MVHAIGLLSFLHVYITYTPVLTGGRAFGHGFGGARAGHSPGANRNQLRDAAATANLRAPGRAHGACRTRRALDHVDWRSTAPGDERGERACDDVSIKMRRSMMVR